MTQNYFQASTLRPYHLSIGGVVVNGLGEVCCHYFRRFEHPSLKEPMTDFYILMRETLEPAETIEQCLARGLQEEFGIEARLQSFLGSLVARFARGNEEIEKTTLYFLCELVSFDETRRADDDPERSSTICWLNPEDLLVKMRGQGKRLGREDADESVILSRLLSTQQ